MKTPAQTLQEKSTIVKIFSILILSINLLWTPPVSAQSLPSFAKSFSPAQIGPGAVSTLRFDIANPTAAAVRNVAFTDNLPAGMTLASPANASVTGCSGSLDAPNGAASIVFSGGGLPASGSCVILVDVTSSTPGTHTNISGDLTSDAGNSGNATADLTVDTGRPGFSKSFSPSSVFFGGRTTLTFTIDNTANAQQALQLRFTDNLPAGMTIASPANAASTCNGGGITAPAGGSSITYGPVVGNDANVGAGASCTVRVDVLGGSIGELGNTTGELTSISPSVFTPQSSGKAAAVLSVAVEQISLDKSFVNDPTAPGGTVNLSFTVRNLDRRSDATDIAFTDDLDAALTGLVATGLPASNVCGSGSVLSGTDVLTLFGGSLASGESCTFSVILQVPASAVPGTYTNTTSSITASVGGDQATGSPATDTLFVEAVPILTKEFVDDPVGVGESVTLEFTLTNTSQDASATGITFQDVLASVTPTVLSVPANGFCGAGSSLVVSNNPSPTLIVSGGNLAPAGSCTFSVVLGTDPIAQSGTYPNVTTEVTATVGGREVTGPAASDDLVIVSGPTLTKEFTDDPVAPGDTVTLQFTLTYAVGDDQSASGDATGITFSDDLDAALSGLVAVGLPAADVCGIGSSIGGTMTLLLTGGTLSPGETCTFGVTLQVPATASPGAHTNTTSAVVATVLGVETTSLPATEDLRIAGLTLTKVFIDDPVVPGGTVTLRFTIENDSPVSAATNIFFEDDLDDAVNNMTGTGLPLADVCGTGSSLVGVSGDEVLRLQGGNLAPGASCTFDVVLQVPAATVSETYASSTRLFFATIEGATVVFDNASDTLVVSADVLALSKEFVGDPVSPGEMVTLRFTVTNLSASRAVDSITFTDDLDAVVSGLTSVSGTQTEVCGTGSLVSGTSLLTFSGGNLPAAGTCVFDVLLTVPTNAALGSVYTNVTSSASGMVNGLEVKGDPATDQLEIDSVEFSKSFGDVATNGGTVTLTFNIENLSATDSITDLSFFDDLDAVLTDLTAIGLPAFGDCGEASVLDGTSVITFSGGSLLPGGSCSFSVTLQVPEDADPGTYLNVTSELQQAGIEIAGPASATLEVVPAEVDEDGDGVLDADDICPGTVIPEGVPTQTLRPNRYALVDDDFVFDVGGHGLGLGPLGILAFGAVTVPESGSGSVSISGGNQRVFTTTDTAGCSCEQIIEALGLGNGHTKFGCSLGAMRNWVDLVNGDPVSLLRLF